jgi:Putative Ig domain
MDSRISLAMLAAATVFLGGCFVDELGGSTKHSNQVADPPAALNHAPTITGTPTPTVVQGEFYEFMPSATDADGDKLQFSVARKPDWAKFDAATGRLWGTPTAQNVGNFTNIRISVSDGTEQVSLAAFDVSVDALANGSATLSWNPPTDNVDGTTLTDLSGYRIYYGRSANQLTRTVVVNNPGLTRYVVENLAPATWHFAMTSVNDAGRESPRSPTVSKTIS